mgnify:CR=1 FL=1
MCVEELVALPSEEVLPRRSPPLPSLAPMAPAVGPIPDGMAPLLPVAAIYHFTPPENRLFALLLKETTLQLTSIGNSVDFSMW